MKHMERSIAFFLKVTKTEYINDLTKNGNLYLTLAEEFRNQRRYGGKKHDSEEGCTSTQYQILVDIGNNNFRNPNTLLDFSNSRVKGNECIYCLKIIYKDEINKKGVFIPNKFFGDLIENDDWSGYSLLLIKNPVVFLDCIENAAKLHDYTYRFNSVQYDNHSFRCLSPLFSDDTAIETYFHKSETFAEQTEFRILLQNTKHEDLKLKIGTAFFVDDNYKQIDNLQFLNKGKPILLK